MFPDVSYILSSSIISFTTPLKFLYICCIITSLASKFDNTNVYLFPFSISSDVNCFVNCFVASFPSTITDISSITNLVSKKFTSVASNFIVTVLLTLSIIGFCPSVYLYFITGFVKSTILFLNAVHTPWVSPSSLQFGFPTNISISCAFVFPDVSLNVFAKILILVTPLCSWKLLNVNLYIFPIFSVLVPSSFSTISSVFLIVVTSLLSTYTFILLTSNISRK